MKVKYDRETDILRIIFIEAEVFESDEEKPGMILDYDDKGNVVGVEILDASKKIEDPTKVELDIAG